MTCVFCEIIAGKIAVEKVYEDSTSLAFVPKDPVVTGHILVIPKTHVENLFDISQQELAKLGDVTKEMAITLKDAYGAQGVNLLHASGRTAQQSVLHFHYHLIPRYEGDGLDMWIKQGL